MGMSYPPAMPMGYDTEDCRLPDWTGGLDYTGLWDIQFWVPMIHYSTDV